MRLWQTSAKGRDEDIATLLLTQMTTLCGFRNCTVKHDHAWHSLHIKHKLTARFGFTIEHLVHTRKVKGESSLFLLEDFFFGVSDALAASVCQSKNLWLRTLPSKLVRVWQESSRENTRSCLAPTGRGEGWADVGAGRDRESEIERKKEREPEVG